MSIEEVDGQQRTQSIPGMAQILGPIAEYLASLFPYLAATCWSCECERVSNTAPTYQSSRWRLGGF